MQNVSTRRSVASETSRFTAKALMLAAIAAASVTGLRHASAVGNTFENTGNPANLLNTAAAWNDLTSGTAGPPLATDIAQWDAGSGLTAPTSFTLGTANWDSMVVTNVGGNVTITNDASNLTLVHGIDMSSVSNGNNSVTILDNIGLNANQTFNVAANRTLTLGAVILNANTLTFAGNGTIAATGVISGPGTAGSLIKNDNGTLILTATNTYGNTFTLNSGTLDININGAMGTATSVIVINGGTIDNTSNATVTLAQQTQTWDANFTYAGTTALNLGTGTVTMTNNVSVTANGNVTLTEGGAINGVGLTLTKEGPGTFIMNGNNSYSGNTVVNAGLLQQQTNQNVPATTAGSSIIMNGGTFATGNDNVLLETLVFNGGTLRFNNYTSTHNFTNMANLALGAANGTASTLGNLTAGTGVITGTKGLIYNGPGSLTLASNNSFSGQTVVNAGTLIQNLPDNNSNITLNAGGFFGIPNDAALGTEIITWNTGTLQFDNYTSNLTFNNVANLALGAANGTPANYAGNITGSQGLVYNGPGSLILTTAQLYSGNTTVNAGVLVQSFADNNSNIVLNVPGALAIFNDAAVGTENIAFNGGSLQLNNYSSFLNFNDKGLVTLGANVGFFSTLLGNLTGNTSFTFAGPGTLLLAGTNTYNGNTTLQGGTLAFSNISNLGTGANISFVGGTLKFQPGNNVDITTARVVTVSNSTFGTGGTVDLAGNSINFNGTVSGNGSLSVINSLGLTNPANLTINAVQTYTGTTGVLGGTVRLNDAAGPLLAGGPLSVGGGGTLNVDIGASAANVTQAFSSTFAATGLGTITSSHTGTGIPTVTLGGLTLQAGASLRIIGPATIGAGNVSLPATGIFTTTTGSANNILASGGGNGFSGENYVTVGLYDWAAKDSTNTIIVGGSQIPGFYNNPIATTSAQGLVGNSDMPAATSNGTVGFRNGGSSVAATSVRFNQPGDSLVNFGTVSSFSGILMTPNVGPHRAFITGVNGDMQANRNNTQAGFVIWQNDVAGVLDIGIGMGAGKTEPDTLTMSGPGLVLLSSNSTYQGQTYLNAGVTEINGDQSFGSLTVGAGVTLNGGAIFANTTMSLSNGGVSNRTITLNGGGGTIAAITNSALTINGAIVGNGGNLNIGIGQVVGTGAGTFLTTAQFGNGTVIISGNNTYTGNTNVLNNATLQMDSTAGTGVITAGAVDGSNVGTLTGIPTGINNRVFVNSGSTIFPGDSGNGTMTLGTLALGSSGPTIGGGIIDFSLSGTSVVTDPLVIASNGTLTLNGTNFINLFGVGGTAPTPNSGTYNLISLGTGGVLGSAVSNTTLVVADPLPRTTYTFQVVGSNLQVIVNSALANATWTGGGGANSNWTLASNWQGGVIPTGASDKATFPGSLGNVTETATLNANETVGNLVINTANVTNPVLAPTTYNFVGTGSTHLTLDNSNNTAGITAGGGTNTFSVPVVLTAPGAAIQVTNDILANLSSVVNMAGAISGTNANLSVSGSGKVILSGNNSYSGTTSVAVGTTLQIGNAGSTGTFGAGNVTANGTLVFNRSDGTTATPVTIGNTIGGLGGLNFTGTGTIELTSVNNFTGPVNITAGRVMVGAVDTTSGNSSLGASLQTTVLNIGANGTLDLNGLGLTKGSVTGAGNIDNSSATPVTLFEGGFSQVDTLSGTISNSGGGNLSITRNSSGGTLILGGNNTYGGNTTILNNAVLSLLTNTAAGTGTIVNGVSNNSGAIQLAPGLVVANPIVANGGLALEILDVPTTAGVPVSATVSGTVVATGAAQWRMGVASTVATIILTGASVLGGSPIVFFTRNNVVYNGTGSLTTTSGVNFGRSSANAESLNLIMNDNSFISAGGLAFGGNGSSSDDANTNVTVNGNASLNGNAGAINLDSGSATTASNVVLTMNGTSTLTGSIFNATGTNQGAITLNFNGATIIGTGGDTASALFFPDFTQAAFLANGTQTRVAGTAIASIQSGGLTINDGGFKSTYAMPFGGAGALNKTGTGTVTLTGSNTYSGVTNVLAGTLFANNTGGTATGSNDINVSANATFGGLGTINGNINVATGGHVSAGAAASVGNLTLGTGINIQDVNMANGTFIDVNFQSDGSNNSKIVLPEGFISAAGSTIGYTFVQAGTPTPFDINGTYDLVVEQDVQALAGGFVPSGETSVVVNPQTGVTYLFSATGSSYQVTISGGNIASQWGNAAGGNWSGNANWTNNLHPHTVGDVATFASAITSNQTVTLDGNETVGNIYFNNANSSYTIAAGSGTLTLDNGVGGTSATATSNITVQAGSHTIAVSENVNSLNLNLIVTNAADSLTISQPISGATGNVTYIGAGKLSLSGNNIFTGKLTLAGSGNVALSGTEATATVLAITGASNVTLSGANAFTGINKAGNGTLFVSVANAYSGATVLGTGGTIQLSGAGTLGNGSSAVSDAGLIDLNGTNQSFGSLAGTAGNVDGNVAGIASNNTLTLGGNNTSTSFGAGSTSIIKNTLGLLAINKVGTGTQTLAGTNTYGGGTTLSGGAIAVGADVNLGAANGSVTFNGGTLAVGSAYTSFPAARTINWSAAGGGINTVSGATFTMNRDMVGGGFTKSGGGTVAFTANYTTSSPTVISAGTLQLVSGTFSSGAITDNGALGFNRPSAGNITITSDISGTGGLTQSGNGTATITGNYTATGAISLATGNITFGTTANTRQDTGVMIKTSNLSIGASSILDISNHDMIIGNTTPATVFNEIANAFGFGPGGAQITSSTVVNNPLGNTFLAVLDANLLGGVGSTWDNVTITDPNSVIIKYTYFGDLNFDGIVDSGDYAVIDGNFGTGNSWITGDANLDGVVDAGDYAVIDGNFGAGTQFGTPLFATPSFGSPAATPEPASLFLLGLGSAGMLLKKRRKM